MNAALELEAPAPTAPLLRPKKLARWTPTPENSPKHQRGAPSPRTSPKRAPRRIAISAALIAHAAAMLFPAPSSAMDRAYPLTRVMRVIDKLCVPNHLSGTLRVIRDNANKHGECMWLSYEDISKRLASSRSESGVLSVRQVIANVGELEALGFISTVTRRDGRGGNAPNFFQVSVPAELRELALEAAAQMRPEAVADQPPSLLIDEEDEIPRRDGLDEEAEIAAARAELLERAAATRAAPPPPATAAPPARPAEPLPPLPRDILSDPAVSAAAVLELLQLREEVFSALPESLEAFAGRLSQLRRREDMPLRQVLIGLWECANKPGRQGRELADFAVGCIQRVTSLRSPPAAIVTIERRAERSFIAARPPPD